MLRQELERQGDWLFRWRSYLPLPVIALLLPALWHFRYPEGSYSLHLLWTSFCLLVALSGLAVRAMAVGHAPRGTSGRNTRLQKADSLNTTGLYSVVRHPLYVGNALMWLGVALFPRSLWMLGVTMLAYWLLYERIMLAEETFLSRKFGAAYDEWAARTPAFIPRLSGWREPALPFCWRTVLRREYSGLLGVIASGTRSRGSGHHPPPAPPAPTPPPPTSPFYCF
jgi:protein-S-isoprenylcysteine O-methyltransferase Ste14